MSSFPTRTTKLPSKLPPSRYPGGSVGASSPSDNKHDKENKSTKVATWNTSSLSGSSHPMKTTKKLQADLDEALGEWNECKRVISSLTKQLETKNDEMSRLKAELDKYRQVVEKPKIMGKSSSDCDKEGNLEKNERSDNFSSSLKLVKPKRIAISGEPTSFRVKLIESDESSHTSPSLLKKVSKSFGTRSLLKNAINENDFMRHLQSGQITEIVDCMYPMDVESGSTIIGEGDEGSIVYIMEDGKVEVSREGKFMSFMNPGCVFGELAILYNCRRTATVKATIKCKLWAIERQVFQTVMMRSALQRQAQYTQFLKSVPILNKLPESSILQIADVLEEETFPNEEYIVRHGSEGDTFFIVNSGRVRVTKNSESNQKEETFIRHLHKGDFFGEKALEGNLKRTANVIADGEKSGEVVSCLIIDRQTFNQLIASQSTEIKGKYQDTTTASHSQKQHKTKSSVIREEFKDISLQDLRLIKTLGVGGFGRVTLVYIQSDKEKRSFALKQMKKKQIVDTRQQQHVMSEKELLIECDCPLVVKLYKTFKDKKYLYMLMEPCLGGELWTILRDRGNFDDNTARFYIGCVMEAFDYIHTRNIIYRDLKPENLIMHSSGYVKLVDFGFAKRLDIGRKTWTFCGTPEYVAPEVILNKGHDISADYWSLGILIFELLAGVPPFTGSDPMKTYNIILKGINAIDFPRTVSSRAREIIKRLCRDNPLERLGFQKGGVREIMRHKWFDGFNWEGLRMRNLTVPIVPKITSHLDTSNFDDYPNDSEPPPPDDLSGWDEMF